MAFEEVMATDASAEALEGFAVAAAWLDDAAARSMLASGRFIFTAISGELRPQPEWPRPSPTQS